jgi:NAD(P)-dependent dehydrogenase (short-subunit alcohol dehydrogenase family)
MRFAGKICLVTGGAGGIGRASARAFCAEGASVIIADIDSAAGAAVEEELKAQGGKALFVETDITDESSVEQTVARARKDFGPINGLFNSAGGSLQEDDEVVDVDMAVWDRTMNLDLKGTFLCCRHTLPGMIEAGGGTIVNMSSGAALRGSSPSHVYTAAKGAILSLTRVLAGRYARDNIRANAICSGRILSARILERYGGDGQPGRTVDLQQASERVKEYPFWVGKPEDIANIALFLASDESRMITGAAIPADGGRSAY